jgi:hypothetical protein
MTYTASEEPRGAAMTRMSTTPAATRELAFRASDGLEVALLWHPRNDVLSVAVLDAKTGEAFELVLGDGEKPLDVFEHPYAYAAYRGLELGEAEFAVAA